MITMQSLPTLTDKSWFKLLLGAAGIYLAYLQVSVLNEKIFSYKYPSRSDPTRSAVFQYADLVQFVSSFFCMIFAFTSSRLQRQPGNPIPWKQVIRLGILYTLNVNSLNYSLYYIPYPVRVVGDKLDYFTAVIVGVYFSRISKNNKKTALGAEQVGRAVVISMGAVWFAYSYKFKDSQMDLYLESERWKGYVLIGISVVMEAVFGDNQAYIKVTYRSKPNHMMFSVNLMTLIFNLAILLFTNTLVPALTFCLQHQQILMDILLVGLLTIVGQVSIYFVIVNFRQHILPLITTTRKIFTILYSIYYFQHSTNVYMWIALLMVFGGIIYELIQELREDKHAIIQPKAQVQATNKIQ